MSHIKITKGLNIPIGGKPEGPVRSLVAGGEASALGAPPFLALNLINFPEIKFRLLVKVGDVVKTGEPLVEDKSTPGRVWVSPGTGIVKDIRRGLKRTLQSIIIEVGKQEEAYPHPTIDVDRATREELIDVLKKGGHFANIRSRPFSFLADPKKKPRSIFVKALESAPFAPPAELQVIGHEKEFQTGLDALKKLTDGKVHLVYNKDTTCKAFTHAQNVEKHTAEGPHPVSNVSVHIQHIDPIASADATIWTIDTLDVISMGYFLSTGRTFTGRVISIAGPGIIPDKIGFFKVRNGYPIASLVSGRIQKGWMRLISGNPLMGNKVSIEDFMGYYDNVFCAIPENTHREFLHFFRLGTDKYSFSRAYLSGHLSNSDRDYPFTTSQHGEHRAFVDSSLYDKVQPLHISTMPLVKAVMAEDYDLAEQLGLLEVDSEDFALPTFVCPSKTEMTEIIKNGLKIYAKDVLQ